MPCCSRISLSFFDSEPNADRAEPISGFFDPLRGASLTQSADSPVGDGPQIPLALA